MSGKAFLDTNIFVYEVDLGAPKAKREIALGLIRDALGRQRGVVSWQVVQEFVHVVTGKLASPMSAAESREYLERIFQPLMMVRPSMELYRTALEIRGRHRISWYDSLIVAAAGEAHCTVLYTEDLQDGATVGGVRIENPFRTKR